jgi:hypothetical protein
MSFSKPSKKMPSEDHPMDLLNGEHSKSAADEYYRFKLREEKLNRIIRVKNNNGDRFLDPKEQEALRSLSEMEKVELKCLARLYQLTDASPEYLQIKSITGGHDREDIAAKLTEKYMEKVQVEDVLNRFISPNTSREIINRGNAAARVRYDAFGRDQ